MYMCLCSSLKLLEYFGPSVDRHALREAERAMHCEPAVPLDVATRGLGIALSIKLDHAEAMTRRILEAQG